METEDIKLKERVERFGVFFEKEGIPPVAARIIGFLLFSEPPRKTFYEIVEFVQASKSSVSTALNAMQERGFVSYITLPGDRKRYFQLDVDKWINLEKRRIQFISNFRGFIQEAAELHQAQSKEFARSLSTVDHFFEEYVEELPKIIAKWEEKIKDNE